MDDEPSRSEPLELTKLGLEVVFGTRGAAMSKYLEKRRADRHRKRLHELRDAASAEGMDQDTLLAKLRADDDLQELFEQIAETAMRSRYEEKIKYLGKVLASAAKGTGDARIDTARLRVRAVADLEPMHVQLLWVISLTERTTSSPVSRSSLEHTAKSLGVDLAAFEACVGLLRRHGLLHESPKLELEIDVEVEEGEKGFYTERPIRAEVDTGRSDVEIGWQLTPLGREMLASLWSSPSQAPNTEDLA